MATIELRCTLLEVTNWLLHDNKYLPQHPYHIDSRPASAYKALRLCSIQKYVSSTKHQLDNISNSLRSTSSRKHHAKHNLRSKARTYGSVSTNETHSTIEAAEGKVIMS